MQRRSVSSGGAYEDVYGYSRAVAAGGQVHVAGTTARGTDLDGDAYRQARAALRIVETALLDPRMRVEIEAYAIGTAAGRGGTSQTYC